MENAGYRLKIIDGFRPQAVQIYMRQFEHDKIARDTGLNPNNLTPDEDRRIWDKVDSVWAKPSSDPSNPPPPHSTGAAIDLTIINSSGQELNMGSDFDEVSDKILPNFYLNQDDFDSVEIHKNRDLLNRVMTSAGFHRLPHEWWHFSYGDQMWALIEAVTTGIERVAIYGEVNQAN
jgi:D-alanyl-D-alanine dipeptidase